MNKIFSIDDFKQFLMSLLSLQPQRQKPLQIMTSTERVSAIAKRKNQIDRAKMIQIIKHLLLDNYALK